LDWVSSEKRSLCCRIFISRSVSWEQSHDQRKAMAARSFEYRQTARRVLEEIEINMDYKQGEINLI